MTSSASTAAWQPVASSDDLVARHIFQTDLHGVELALWRDDDGCVNAWENRCCHRSARLSIGTNLGRRLRCQYHGWQYRSGDGQCIIVPAATQAPPPASICARTFGIAEAHGLVWVGLQDEAGATAALAPQDWLLAADGAALALRSFVWHADFAAARAALEQVRAHDPAWEHAQVDGNERALALRWSAGGTPLRLTLLLQPARPRKTLVHSVLQTPAPLAPAAAADWQRRHYRALAALRQQLIAAGVLSAVPLAGAPFVATPPRRPGAPSRARLLRARVTGITTVAEGIRAFELEPANPADVGALADFLPGAHIDITTPAGLLRQYSIASLPGAINASSARRIPGVVVGVQRAPHSRGGSASMHDAVLAGSTLEVSRPKNHFRIANNRGALFLAGGIGITPVLAMAQHMQAAGHAYALHYFARSTAHVAFRERLAALAHQQVHTGLTPQQTQGALRALVAALAPDTDLYVCGPRPFLDAVKTLAAEHAIDADRVHFELFANAVTHAGDRPFRVRLARSGREIDVPAGQTLAAALNAAGVAVETSCEQGVCGTCMVRVLEGAIDHRDVYLSADEKRAGNCMQACVSRAAGDRLVLDL